MNNNNNNNNQEEFCFTGLQLLCLTPEEDEYQYDDYEEETDITWIDDCECQENLGTILSLSPEACIVDSDNHILSMDAYHLFFEELGCFTEEPEPIDPTRDYDAEAKQLIEERNKTRKQHVDLCTPVPSLDDTTTSGISSTSSSFHTADEQHSLAEIRSPLYLGGPQKITAYAYASNTLNASRTPI
jgi:hypothetical protein